VIHCGMYYGESLLKTTLCVRGNPLLYELCRAHGTLTRGRRIVPPKQRDFALAEQEPSVFDAGFVSCEDATGALEPAVGDGGVAAKGQVVPNEPEGHARRATRVVGVAIEPVGTFARIKSAGGVVQPPRGEAELLPGGRRFPGSEALLELAACLFPGTAAERRAPRFDQSGRGVFQSLVMMNSGAPSNS